MQENMLPSTIIYVAEITRYFNAEEYSKNGYQSATTLSENMIFPIRGTKTLISKDIAQSRISFFPFKWLDTSAISFVDFGTHFNNYRVQSESMRFLTNQGTTVLFEINY